MPEDEQQLLRNKFLKEMMTLSDEGSDDDSKKQPEQAEDSIFGDPISAPQIPDTKIEEPRGRTSPQNKQGSPQQGQTSPQQQKPDWFQNTVVAIDDRNAKHTHRGTRSKTTQNLPESGRRRGDYTNFNSPESETSVQTVLSQMQNMLKTTLDTVVQRPQIYSQFPPQAYGYQFANPEQFQFRPYPRPQDGGYGRRDNVSGGRGRSEYRYDTGDDYSSRRMEGGERSREDYLYSFDTDDRSTRRDDRGSREFRSDDRGSREFRSDDRGSREFRSDDRGRRDSHSDDRGSRDFRRERPRLSQLPKSLTFNGKGSWKAFQSKFKKYASINEWTEDEKLDYLCMSLTDSASEYYALVMDRDPELDYDQLIEKMERRFGYQELPETAMIKFSNACQDKNELLDEWADRILTLATKAFRNLPDEHMNSQAILRFCHGLNDKAAGESVANMRPSTMDDAIDKVKWAKYGT
jgi:hypothetical protein